MDHHEKHHLHHDKEREHKKEERKQHEHEEEKQLRSIHPAWFLAIGVVLIAAVVVLWTMM